MPTLDRPLHPPSDASDCGAAAPCSRRSWRPPSSSSATGPSGSAGSRTPTSPAPRHLRVATENITVAIGIVNIRKSPAVEAAAWFHRLEKTHPGRFMLGVGVGAGHRARIALWGQAVLPFRGSRKPSQAVGMSTLPVTAPEVDEAVVADAGDDHRVLVLVQFSVYGISPSM